MCDSKPSLSVLLTTDSKKAVPTPMHIDTTMSSSSGVVSGRLFANANAMPTDNSASRPSERKPGVPSSSRMVRASAGSAGTHAGRITLMSRM